jgi:hypothetical protein
MVPFVAPIAGMISTEIAAWPTQPRRLLDMASSRRHLIADRNRALYIDDMRKISYAGYRFPPEIIRQAIWLYLRFTLSLRDLEDLLAERGIEVSYETVRRSVNHFGPMIAADLRKRRPKPHSICWGGRPPTASIWHWRERTHRALAMD